MPLWNLAEPVMEQLIEQTHENISAAVNRKTLFLQSNCLVGTIRDQCGRVNAAMTISGYAQRKPARLRTRHPAIGFASDLMPAAARLVEIDDIL